MDYEELPTATKQHAIIIGETNSDDQVIAYSLQRVELGGSPVGRQIPHYAQLAKMQANPMGFVAGATQTQEKYEEVYQGTYQVHIGPELAKLAGIEI